MALLWNEDIVGFVYYDVNAFSSTGYLAVPVCTLLIALVATPKNRARVQSWLQRLAARGEERQAAAIAHLLGQMAAGQALKLAKERFRGLPLSGLQCEDFSAHVIGQRGATAATERLRLSTKHLALGDCDSFLSHSWHDNGADKWAALQQWADTFRLEHESREPIIWLDKACIDQANVDRDLACLPIFLAGCRSLLVLAGPTYFVRLWCIMEIFTFIYMGGSMERVTFVPLMEVTKAEHTSSDQTTSAAHQRQRDEITLGFRNFDASNAKCANPEDRDRLLGIVESACGSLDAFSSIVHETFAPQVEQMFTSKFGSRTSMVAVVS